MLAEMLVALLVSATLLLGAFALLTNGTRLLSALEDRNSERFGLEAGLAAFRADLAQAVDVGTLEAGLDVDAITPTFYLELVRLVINPVDSQPMLTRIGWHFGKDGIVRKLIINSDLPQTSYSFIDSPVVADIDRVSADILRLDLKVRSDSGSELMATAFLPMPTPDGIPG